MLVLLSISTVSLVILCITSIVVGLTNYCKICSSGLLESAGALIPDSSWTGGMSIPAPRSEASATVLGNRIYIIGGDDTDEKVTNVVRVYDPNTDHWSVSAPLPIPIDHTGSAAYNDKIYVVGGFIEGKRPTDSLLIYDPVANEWQKGKPLPEPRGALTADFINGTLYAAGGVDASHTPVATNEAYDPKTNTWTERAPMPTPRHHHTSAVVDGKLYVIGGRILGNGVQSQINEALTNLDDNEMYNPLNDSWTMMEPMPTKRSGIASAASPVNGNIYVFGGENPFKDEGAVKTFDVVEKYDPKSNSWTTEQVMPTARHGLAAMVIDGKIYVVSGGTKPGLSVSDVNEVFSVIANK